MATLRIEQKRVIMILMLSFFILFKIVKLKSFIDLANWVNQKEVFKNMVYVFLKLAKELPSKAFARD
jgi:hypothetical protein